MGTLARNVIRISLPRQNKNTKYLNVTFNRIFRKIITKYLLIDKNDFIHKGKRGLRGNKFWENKMKTRSDLGNIKAWLIKHLNFVFVLKMGDIDTYKQTHN